MLCQRTKPQRASMRTDISVEKRVAMFRDGEPHADVKKKSVRVRKSVRKSRDDVGDEKEAAKLQLHSELFSLMSVCMKNLCWCE